MRHFHIARGAPLAALLAASQLLAGCVVPGHMNVSNGLEPENADRNVRFQSTYYFRAFDYCWMAKSKSVDGKPYREIVPETDVIYRYRLTGRASALGNKTQFESGTLDAKTIDPFGKSVRFDKANDLFMKSDGSSSSGGKEEAPTGGKTNSAETTPGSPQAETPPAADGYCTLKDRMRGFQIMGPEGMRDFDQNSRLIVAMHSSAEPLIDTLNEYSGRLLKPRVNPAEQLLPLARESNLVLKAEAELDQLSLRILDPGATTKPGIGDVFDKAIATFTPPAPKPEEKK
jgi:hypothetical protein